MKRTELAIQTNAVSEQELDRALAQRDKAQATVISAKANLAKTQLDLSYTEVRAPITGKIGRSLVDAGNLVGNADPTLLCTINKMNPIFVYFDMPESKMLDFLQSMKEAGINVMKGDTRAKPESDDSEIGAVYLGLSNEKGFPRKGRIDYVDNTVNPDTGTIQVRAVFPNDDFTLFPGLFVRLRLPGGAIDNAILILQQAVASDIGGKYVYIVDEKNIVEQQYVELGAEQDDGTILVLDGLQDTARYIVNGMLRARPGLPVTPKAEVAPAAKP